LQKKIIKISLALFMPSPFVFKLISIFCWLCEVFGSSQFYDFYILDNLPGVLCPKESKGHANFFGTSYRIRAMECFSNDKNMLGKNNKKKLLRDGVRSNSQLLEMEQKC